LQYVGIYLSKHVLIGFRKDERTDNNRRLKGKRNTRKEQTEKRRIETHHIPII